MNGYCFIVPDKAENLELELRDLYLCVYIYVYVVDVWYSQN